MVAAGGYLHSEGTERWDFFLYNTTSTYCNIDTKLNQHLKKLVAAVGYLPSEGTEK